jgi:hypothetical protein
MKILIFNWRDIKNPAASEAKAVRIAKKSEDMGNEVME